MTGDAGDQLERREERIGEDAEPRGTLAAIKPLLLPTRPPDRRAV